VIRPNELSNPGERAAYARVDALFQRLDEFSPTILSLVPRSTLDAAVRDQLLAEVERLADRLGRRELLDRAVDHCRDALLTRFVAQFRGRTGGSSPARSPEAEAAAIAIIVDAVAVAVVEDQLSLADAEALAGPGRRLLGIETLEPTGATRGALHPHASHAARRAASEHDAPAGADPARETRILGAPSARDWAEADDPDLDEPTSGRSPTTRIVLGIAAIGLAVGVLVAGVAGGMAALALAGAVALVAVVASLRMREPEDD
jgi:hypothetical protein